MVLKQLTIKYWTCFSCVFFKLAKKLQKIHLHRKSLTKENIIYKKNIYKQNLPVVGSSKKSIEGERTNSMPIFVRFLSPPDRLHIPDLPARVPKSKKNESCPASHAVPVWNDLNALPWKVRPAARSCREATGIPDQV